MIPTAHLASWYTHILAGYLQQYELGGRCLRRTAHLFAFFYFETGWRSISSPGNSISYLVYVQRCWKLTSSILPVLHAIHRTARIMQIFIAICELKRWTFLPCFSVRYCSVRSCFFSRYVFSNSWECNRANLQWYPLPIDEFPVSLDQVSHWQSRSNLGCDHGMTGEHRQS